MEDKQVDEIIGQKIDQIARGNNFHREGRVAKISSFVVEVVGLDGAFFFERVTVGNEGNIGYVDRIIENRVYIALLKVVEAIRIDDKVVTSGEMLSLEYSEGMMGMIIDPFGVDRISGQRFENARLIPVERPNISIPARRAVVRPLETGIAAIDLMYAIGRGQRQLIIGDKKTGKTQILLDTIANQKGKKMICIYVAIGITKRVLKTLYADLLARGAGSYTMVVAAFNDDQAPMMKIAPYAAMSIAEELMNQGKDVLVCIDDLKKHADACREIALLSEKNTGRDAYPADIFYSHSRFLDKGCQHENGGSISILPVMETRGGDITEYISTNVISITDGQIVLSEKNFKKGQRPAVDYGLSVSRLGGAVQTEEMKKIGSKLRRELLSYLETADVYQLVDPKSMTEELQKKIKIGKEMLDRLRQGAYSPMDTSEMVRRLDYERIVGDVVKGEEVV